MVMKNEVGYWKEKFVAAEDEMIPENYADIKARLRFLRKKYTERTVINQTRLLIRFGKWAKKPFKEMDGDDMDDYLDTLEGQAAVTISTTMQVIKTLMKGVNPEAAKAITPAKIKNDLTPDSLLTEDEITRMIKYSTNLRDKAMFACLWDSGCRKSELISTTIKDAVFDKHGCLLWLRESKTSPRPARLVFASSYLHEWLSVHPNKDKKDNFIFCSLFEPYGKLSDNGIYEQVKRIAKKAGITKKATPHKWRHTRATDLSTKITEQEMKNVLGWKPNSNMTAVYVHLSAMDVNKTMLKANGIEIDDGDKEPSLLSTERCPKCREINDIGRDICHNCGDPLSEVARFQVAEAERKMVADEVKRQIDELKKSFGKA